MAAVRSRGPVTVAAVLPARDEAATVGPIVRELLVLLDDGLVDEVVVVDDGSRDGTGRLAEVAGARVIRTGAAREGDATRSGKGSALWEGLAATTADVIVFVDADLVVFDPGWVPRLVAPLLADDDLVLVKGAYDRPIEADGRGGGRTTELVARPLLSMFFPGLAPLRQPLGGEYAGRRRALEAVPFVTGYGVEVGLLIDLAARHGDDAIAEVDLGVRHHRPRSLTALSAQAMEITQTVLLRAGVDPSSWSTTLVRPGLTDAVIEITERPPLTEPVPLNGRRGPSPVT